jgi:hypothetical protein
VRNLTRQFVLFVGTLLSFSNGGSLFAGVICVPESIVIEPPDVFPKDIVPRDPIRPPTEEKRSELKSSELAKVMSNCPDKTTSTLDGPLQILGKSFSGPREKPSGPGRESNGLDGEDGSRPAPWQPSAPSERGETGAAGTVPTIGPKDQQIGLFTCSIGPTPEGEERLIFHNVRLYSDSPIARLFRPPRERS